MGQIICKFYRTELAVWDEEHVGDLLEILDQLNRISQEKYGQDADIDMSELPGEIPAALTPYDHAPIWTCDKNGCCLIGDSADKIESVENLIAMFSES